MSASTIPGPKGITAQPTSAKVKVRIGAMMKRPRFAPEGMIVSLRKSLRPSAKLWSRPNGPTTFGPRLSAIAAQILRSP
jgi:hypothetical protein